MRGRSPVLVVLGTRPEAIKCAPVINALRDRRQPVVVALTGQHPDLAIAMLAEVGIHPDIDLGANRTSASPAQLLASILQLLPPVMVAHRPGLVLVQGDTVSALAGALAAGYAQVPVGHVEAGLRSNDRDEPFPEEMQRAAISSLAALHFAPTETAARTLHREGIDPANVFITGNSGIDALMATLRRLRSTPELVALMEARFPFVARAARPLVLLTAHRRESIGPRLRGISRAVERLARMGVCEIILPMHPNPAVSGIIGPTLSGIPGVHIVPPVEHAAMVWLMQQSQLVMTDSGGLQEEAPTLGRRVLVLREVTERPEAIDVGAAELVGTRPDRIVSAVRQAVKLPPIAPVFPYGDGNAGRRIADILVQWFGVSAYPREEAL
ncbi:MAG: non-hydrolyzing UDP-N-acetylglucosamine 2-epimerase [Thermaurantiacus sp.]